MTKVKYVGAKDIKTDNVAMTNTVWAGNGDVQEVSEAAWLKLAKHPDIWERVDEEPVTQLSLADSIKPAEPMAIADIVRKKPGPKPKAVA